MEINVIRWLLTLMTKYTGNHCLRPNMQVKLKFYNLKTYVCKSMKNKIKALLLLFIFSSCTA